MRAVLQRVKQASVKVGERTTGQIGNGLLVFIGVSVNDTDDDLEYICRKIKDMRIFEDSEGKMNLSVEEVGGAVLLVSQFTLYADVRKGRRPGFSDAARPGKAVELYNKAAQKLRDMGLNVETGEFQALMAVELINDGPVTILLDSERMF